MPRDFLGWLPESMQDQTDDWDFQSTVSSAMAGIKDAGTQVMQPVGQQLASLMPAPQPASDVMLAPQPAPQLAPQPQQPEQSRFSLGSLEDWGFGSKPLAPEPQQLQQQQPVTHETGSFSLPDLSAWMPGSGSPATSGSDAATATASGATSSPAAPTTSQPGPAAPSDFRAYLRQAAAKRGIDPDQVSAVMGREGPGGWDAVGTFNTGTSYGPLQLHYAGGSNPQAGMGDAFTKATGVDLRTDHSLAAHQRAVDYALDELSKDGDYHQWYGADPALGSRFAKVKRVTPSAPESTSEIPGALGAVGRAAGQAVGQAITGRGAQTGLDVSGITKAYAGVPYTYGGPGGRSNADLGTPTDCSGFVSAVWGKEYGLPLVAQTDGAYNQLRGLGAQEVKASDAHAGDVVFYLGAGTGGQIAHHMGVYAGDGKVLDMSVSGGDGVKERSLGHAGQYVILRDPRLGGSTPGRATDPDPIVSSGVAELSGGRKPTEAQVDAASENQIGQPWNLPFGDRRQDPRMALMSTSYNDPDAAQAQPQAHPFAPPDAASSPWSLQPVWDAGRRAGEYLQTAAGRLAPTETEASSMGAPFVPGTAAGRTPFTPPDASETPPSLAPVGQAAQGLTNYLQTRLDPVLTPGLARQGAIYEGLSPQQVARFQELETRRMGSGLYHDLAPLTPDEQDELGAFHAAGNARYQAASPDEVASYRAAAPDAPGTDLVAGMAVAPLVGGAAAAGAGRVASSLGAGPRLARGIGYAADLAGQSVVDPTNLAFQPAADAALAGVKGLVRGVRAGAGAIADRLGSASDVLQDDGVQLLGGGFVPRDRRPAALAALEEPPPGTRGVEAARYADELAAAGAPESSIKKWRSLANADLATPQELAGRLGTAPLVTPEEARAMLGDRPEYLQPVAAFLLEQRRKLLSGAMTARDVAKAYAITLMSMRSSANEQRALEAKLAGGFTTGAGEAIPGVAQLGDLDNLVSPHTGERLGAIFTEPNPRTGRPEVRPESLGAAWLWTDEGQRALNSIEEGDFIPEAWDGLRRARTAFGSDTVGGNGALRPLTPREVERGMVNMTNLPQFVDELNAQVASLKAQGRSAEIGPMMTQQARRLNGIGEGKSAFVKQLLGLGDGVTIDAREINYWLGGKGLLGRSDTGPGAQLARATSQWWTDRSVSGAAADRIRGAVADLVERYPELTEGIPPEDAAHILHHWIWDRAGGSATQHTDVMKTQRLAAGLAPSTSGGLGADAFNAAQGGVLGAASEDLQAEQEGRETDRGEQLRRAGIGAGLGLLAGNRAGRSALGASMTSDAGARELGAGFVPKASSEISPLGRRVMDTYTAVTPARAEAATERTIQIASDAIAGKIPRSGGLRTSPEELVSSVHAAVVRNLADTKTVMTGIRPGAILAYLRGEGLTSKVETRDLAKINEITQGQVNVAGGRAGKPYTLEQAADFAQRESEQMRVATGGTRFPDPETGAVDEEAPRVMYAYVSEGQPLVGPNRPTAWLVWDDDTPRITSAHHPYGLTSPGQDIHASMPPGLKAAIWNEHAVAGGRAAPAVMEGGRLVEAADAVTEGVSPLVMGWEQAGRDVGGGRKIAETNWLVGPEGEDAMRANGLVLGMSQELQKAIASGAMTDPEQVAAVLMRGGSPKWKPGWAAVMNPSRSESLVVDPSIEKVKAIYLTGVPKDLETPIPNTGGMTVRQLTEKLRADINQATGGAKDVPVLFTDISRSAKSGTGGGVATSMQDARLLAGTPLEGGLAPGRGRIVDAYTQAINPKTKAPYEDIGAGMVPRAGGDPASTAANAAQGALVGAAGESLEADREGRESDPWRQLGYGAAGAGLGMLAGNRAAREALGAGARELGAGFVPRRAVDPDEVADLARRAAAVPMTAPHNDGEHAVRNVAQQVKKQIDAGVAPQHPAGPMPPPDPPPGWWDHAENWRYNVGIFAQLSTAAVQGLGGAVSALGGGTAEAIRLAVLRGQGEALPIIAGEGLKAIPGAVGSAVRTALGNVPEAIEAGSDYRPSLGGRERAAGRPVRGAIADLVGAPGRIATQSPDAFWHELFYRSGIAQAAADAAREELGGAPIRGIAGGLAGGAAGYESTPDDASPWQRAGRTLGGAVVGGALASAGPASIARARRTRELIANPTPEILAEADRLAKEATYKGQAGPILNLPKAAGAALVGEVPSAAARKALGAAGSFLLPIYNTIARIHERGLEYVPGIGAAPLEQVGLAAKGAARAGDRRLAQQAVGIALGASALSYAAAGNIRGPGPSDPNKAQAMRDQGYTPNTTNVAGYWVPNSWFGEFGPMLNQVGAINDARLYEHGDKAWDDLEWWKQGEAMLKNTARSIRDYPALDAASTVMELGTNPTAAWSSLLGEVGAQYVPGPVRTSATASDPKNRTTAKGKDVPPLQRIEETFAQRSGLGRQDLPAAQDILGRETENPRQGWAALLPNIKAEKRDPVIAAYLDAGVSIGDPATSLSLAGVPSEIHPDLTPAERRRWDQLRGEAIVKRAAPALAGSGLSTAPREVRQAELEKWRRQASEEAHTRLAAEIGGVSIRERIAEKQRQQRRAAS